MRGMGFVVIFIITLLFALTEFSLQSQSSKEAFPANMQKGADAKIARGKKAFSDICEDCHDPASNAVRIGPGLKGVFAQAGHKHADGTQQVHTLDEIQKRLERGGENMPPMLGILTADQIDDVLAFLKTL